MPKVKGIEKKIWDVEGFDVRIRHKDGRDVRSDLQGLRRFAYERAAKNDMTVAAWKDNRFFAIYPEFEIEVLDADDEAVPGHTKLGTVRDTYYEE